jgi:hypothetical protein
MKKIYKTIIAVLLAAVMILPLATMAGNKDRSGQAGASELLINPWARSSGWGGVNVANSFGLESIYTNVAGLAFTKKTELIFANTQWLKGSEIGINNFGIAQKIGESSVLGITMMSMNFGDLPITTTELPEGGLGTFSPSYMNINIAYAKAFSNAIYGGFNLKIISESISDVGAHGIAVDAGIQYVTGERENIHFGISLKNVGPTMKFKGDGLSIRSFLPGQESQFTVEQRSADFELPSQLNIGASYAFLISDIHTLTAAAAFVSNAFYKDQYIIGLEYNLKNYLMLRGAYSYEEGINNNERTTALTGLSGGISVQVPISKEKNSAFSVDYSYRATNPFKGSHTMAVRLSF